MAEQLTLAGLFDSGPSKPRRYLIDVDLPAFLREVADVAGKDAAFRLADRYGGTRIYFPRRSSLDPGHPLVCLLGEERAGQICDRWMGLHVDVPRGVAVDIALRHQEVRALRRKGWTVVALAKRFRLTERSIYSILKG